jgi:hypothetical protein
LPSQIPKRRPWGSQSHQWLYQRQHREHGTAPISATRKIINLMVAGIPESAGISLFRPSDH